MYSTMISYFYLEIPGKYAINYYICAGLDPAIDPYDYDKVLNINSSCPRNMEEFGNGGKNARTFLKFQ